MSEKLEKESKQENDEKLKKNGEDSMLQLQKKNDQNPKLQILKKNEENPMFQVIKIIDDLGFADDDSNEDEDDEYKSEEKPKAEKDEPKIVRTVAYFAVGPKSRRIICPFCGEHVKTKSRPGCMVAVSKIIAVCLCLCCCGICCWCLACLCRGCCPQVFTKYRFCPECDNYLGYYRRPEL